MSSGSNKFFLTTPIYYVNARPHIGHAYTTIVADVLARRHRLLGDDTFFLTGTDEHGQKIERSAAAAGIPPQQFADEVSASFEGLWKRMGIIPDKFIRTTDPAHQRGVQKLFADLYQRGQIYLSSYTGQYSIGEEMFVDGPPGTIGPDGKPTETVTEENFFFRLSDYQLPLLNLIESDTLKITPESRKNEVLSFLRGPVNEVLNTCMQEIIASDIGSSPIPDVPGDDSIAPAGRAYAVEAEYTCIAIKSLSHSASGALYVPGALKDLSVSRSSFTWGIPVPEPAASEAKEKHVIYVWLDALANYMTALGYGSEDDSLWQKFWPADLHLVGKEIIRFHCVYWPAFLLALNPKLHHMPNEPAPQLSFEEHREWAEKWLPKAVTAHGWLLFDDSKMSKSKGNIVRTETILDAFGELCPRPLSFRSEAEESASPLEAPQPTKAQQDLFASDILRYFLLREVPFGQDGSFSFEALVTRYNADLANGYGNLVSRTLTMIQNYFGGRIPDPLAGEHAEFTKSRLAYYCFFYSATDPEAHDDFDDLADLFLTSSRYLDFGNTLKKTFHLISVTDSFLSEQAPWKITGRDAESIRKRASILYAAAEDIRLITVLLQPILPTATAKVWQQLGFHRTIEQMAINDESLRIDWGHLEPGTKLGPLSPIFPRADKKLIEIMTQMEQDKNTPITHANAAHDTTPEPKPDFAEAPIASDSTHPAAAPRTSTLAEPNPGAQVGASSAATTERTGTPSHTEAASGIFSAASESPQITIDDFAKVELRVAKILIAERIPKADKLLRLEVDLGYEKRQILSGIAEFYTPEELIGRRIVVITNLAPRKMRGLESHGMLLAASDGEHGKPVLATFADSEDIPLGSRLK